MKNKIKKLNIVLLSLVMVFSLAIPAMAAVTPVAQGPQSGSTLVLCYKPGGNTPTAVDAEGNKVGITFSLYRVAEPNQDYSAYQLADGYEGAELEKLVTDLNDRLFLADNPDAQKYQDAYPEAYEKKAGASFSAGVDYETVQKWIRSFGGYINNNTNNAEESNTSAKALSSQDMTDSGKLKFSNLPDGIYLVASDKSYTVNGTRYIAAPFIIQLPYVSGSDNNQVVNNYVTAYAKWFTPVTPPPPPSDYDQTPTQTPTQTPDNPVDIPDEDVPLGEPEIEDIPDEEVPLADLPDIDEIDPDIEIPDEEVPLAMLPQTGLLWWPVPVMGVAGLMCLGIGTISKKKGHE